jgi:biopolymer transport protein ExbD
MRFTRKKSQRSDFEIVVTSMLDINFLLIMFFMLTAQVQRNTQTRLQLPQEQGEKQAKIDESGLVINMTAAGDIIVSGRTVDLEDLRSMVRSKTQELPADSAGMLKLMVRADREASTKMLNRVVAMLREMNVGTIRIATEVPM